MYASEASYLPEPFGRALESVVALGKTESQNRARIGAGHERRDWNRGDAVFLDQPEGKLAVALPGDRRIVHHLEISTTARQRPEARSLDEAEEQIALGLVKRCDGGRRRILHDEFRVRTLD